MAVVLELVITDLADRVEYLLRHRRDTWERNELQACQEDVQQLQTYLIEQAAQSKVDDAGSETAALKRSSTVREIIIRLEDALAHATYQEGELDQLVSADVVHRVVDQLKAIT